MPVAWIDVHTHPYSTPGESASCLELDCLDAITASYASYGVRKALMMPMPAPMSKTGESDVADAAKQRPDAYGFLNGGFSLNPLIHDAVKAGSVSPSAQAQFDQAADAIAGSGALGYGELTALHFSFNEQHPYEEAPPDHPLFLRLADDAARHNITIDLHMELVLQDKPTPEKTRQLSSHNSPTLKANRDAFERLLAHNRSARISWAHVGWDNTGDMTTGALRELLAENPNLFLQLKGPLPPPTFPEHGVLDSSGRIQADWLALLEDFPDRAVIGTDCFYSMPKPQFQAYARSGRDIVQALPGNLRTLVGLENAERIYGTDAD